MDLVRLGLPYNSSYKPDELIEGYSSLIWTERFQEAGEFELHTPNIEETMTLLPADTLISHLGTGDVMMVETHDIDTDDSGGHTLVVRGRSLDAFLDHRWVESKYQKKRPMRKKYPAYGAAEVLLWNSLDNGSGKDVTRGDPDADEDNLNDYSWNTLDKVPNIAITHSCNISLPSRNWWLEEGNLYPQLLKIMLRGDLGIRMLRPSDFADAYIVTVASGLATRGDITREFTSNITQLCFDIFDGRDRTSGQSANPRVAFNYNRGDVDNTKYLFSTAIYKTGCEIMSTYPPADQYREGTSDGSLTGLQRRMMGFDAGDPEFPPEPEKPDDLRKNATKAEKEAHADAIDTWLTKHATWKNKRDRIIDDFKTDAADDAQRALKKQRKVHMMTGDISPLAPYVFKTDYNLGDKVDLIGDYDQSVKMIVTEFIRTEDAEGDRGYPGLTLP